MSLIVKYDDDTYCEHCGENHEYFGISVLHEGTFWCVTCAEGVVPLSKVQVKEFELKELKERKKWLEKELKKLG
jgi:recombinational DNA repair protein (RecF pathway)